VSNNAAGRGANRDAQSGCYSRCAVDRCQRADGHVEAPTTVSSPGGTFMMRGNDDSSEKPAHRVTVKLVILPLASCELHIQKDNRLLGKSMCLHSWAQGTTAQEG
jgi:hypothetical protein